MAYINRLIELNSNSILLVEQQLNILNQLINMNGNIKTTNTTLNNLISLTTTNNTTLNNIYNKIGYTIQDGSFVLNDDIYKETTRWFDISSYIYIVCYYMDLVESTSTPIDEINADLMVEFSFTNDDAAIIINPNITIAVNNTISGNRYGILNKTDVPGINYMRFTTIITDPAYTLKNIYFSISGVK